MLYRISKKRLWKVPNGIIQLQRKKIPNRNVTFTTSAFRRSGHKEAIHGANLKFRYYGSLWKYNIKTSKIMYIAVVIEL